ncbi:hypothetical protein [Actinoplanes aureus]|uniref:LPXTG cell wall anchor domain-containing protein n=1 Tax=Actinoplanes aureus TaxID=2792083 RepID=A0A931CDD9_9ACTN|nr:hypothetical protein [Actinoplanes aureus]MBG0567845.1 hypothetical protein [Actinoplanes aureus]
MRSGPRLAAVLSALAFLLLALVPVSPAAAQAEPKPETVGAPELPGGGTSPMLLAAIGGYLLTGGLALLLLRR